MMIKICGITNRADAIAAVEAGAAALGFNFYAQSPRFVSAEQAREIAEDLDVLKVGIFVDETPEIVTETAQTAGLDVLQLYGCGDPAEYAPFRVWKAFKVDPAFSANEVQSCAAEAILLDGPTPGRGAGFDWNLATTLSQRIVVSGGLGPDNVAEAIRQVRPWGVDACSRLEIRPGIKDHERVRRFIEAAKTAGL